VQVRQLFRARRIAPESVPDPLFESNVHVDFTWRVDGLMASRSWSTGPVALVYGYDGAKRVIRECNGTAGACGSPAQIDIERSYDRAGNVTAETQYLRAGSGSSVAGADQQGTQSFTYDPLNRVLTSTLGSITKAYTYDSDGNRLTVTEGGEIVDTFVFDTTDQTISDTVGDVTTYFDYDRYGNLASSTTSAASVTTYTSDLADRMTSITEPDGTEVAFAFDAAGRHASRTVKNVNLAAEFDLAARSSVDDYVGSDIYSQP
jgi:YD repeat-containing protein